MFRMTCAFVLAAALGFDAAAGAEAKAEGETKTGTVAAKPANAPEGALAILKVKSSSGTGRRASDKVDVFNLMASGAELAVKIKELAAKEGYAEVTGVISEDTIRVTAIKEVPKPPEPEKKKGRGKKAEE